MVVLYTLSKLFNVKTACVDVLNQENKTLFLSVKTLYFLSFYCSKECRAFITVRLLQAATLYLKKNSFQGPKKPVN